MYNYAESPIRILDTLIEEKLYCVNRTSQQLWSSLINGKIIQIDTFQETNPQNGIGPWQLGNLIRCSAQFLDFMWCFCFWALVSQEESQRLLIQNPIADTLAFSDTKLCNYYNQIFQQMDLISTWNDSSIWPTDMYSPANLPNGMPTTIKDYIGKANSLYTTAIVYVLSHELGHYVHNHKYIRGNHAHNIEIELQADQFALNLVFSDNPQGDEMLNRTYGCILGCLSCLHLYGFPGIVKDCLLDENHPSLQSRLEKIIQHAIPSSGRTINGVSTDKEYFFHMISQIIGFYLLRYCHVELPSYDAGDNCERYFHRLLPFVDQYMHS